MSDVALYEYRLPAVVISLNRPDKLNALNRALIEALTAAFSRAGDDPAVRCVVLTGVGKAFCAGMDLAELAESLEPPGQTKEIWDNALRLANLYDVIYSSPKPTIAAVNGSAVAGGAGLISVCDLAVAVPHARIGYPEVRRGLVAAMVMPHLLRHVGERMARHLLLTGELIDAEEACQAGLINRVVSAANLLDHAQGLACALAEGGPQALAKTKSLLKRFSRQALSVEETAHASAEPRLSEECQLGLKAFFAKQAPPWASEK